MGKQYFEVAIDLLRKLAVDQAQQMTEAAQLIADAIMKGGVLQSFGSGHSYAAAIEVAGRAGGLIPSKVIREPAMGMYESVNGVGEILVKKLDVRPEDVVILISNSGRNPLPVTLAAYVKEQGAKLIVVTALEASKELSSLHVSGKKLYEFADVILDNGVAYGDASIDVPGLPVKVCGTSSIAAAALLQQTILESIEIMIAHDYVPPVYMSANLDGGREFNDKLLEAYAERLNRF